MGYPVWGIQCHVCMFVPLCTSVPRDVQFKKKMYLCLDIAAIPGFVQVDRVQAGRGCRFDLPYEDDSYTLGLVGFVFFSTQAFVLSQLFGILFTCCQYDICELKWGTRWRYVFCGVIARSLNCAS